MARPAPVERERTSPNRFLNPAVQGPNTPRPEGEFVFEVVIVRDELRAVVHDEDTADVQLDVALSLLVLHHVEGSAFGDERRSFS